MKIFYLFIFVLLVGGCSGVYPAHKQTTLITDGDATIFTLDAPVSTRVGSDNNTEAFHRTNAIREANQ
jgi:uncharacterized protein YceK